MVPIFRFKNGRIYTYIGEVCVSVNPYKTMNIYDQQHVEQYKGELKTVDSITGTVVSI